MCIISFYKQNNQLILTHNRDESIDRIASNHILERSWEGKKYFAPVDEEKQGTWIFYNDDYLACILNGGKEKPITFQSSYRKSRGIVLLDIMKYDSVEEFVEHEDLSGIAPFTIFVNDLKNKKTFLLFWDENRLDVNDLSDQNFVFRCSSTLYSLEKMRELENIFIKFKHISPEEIFELHNSIKMNDGDVVQGKATTSITQIFVNESKISMKYCPLF